jgi:hypothetical protein
MPLYRARDRIAAARFLADISSFPIIFKADLPSISPPSQIDFNGDQAYRFMYELGAIRHSYSIWRCDMGPTKTIVKGTAIYDAKTGKAIKEGLSTQQAIEDYAAHHYVVLPEMGVERPTHILSPRRAL